MQAMLSVGLDGNNLSYYGWEFNKWLNISSQCVMAKHCDGTPVHYYYIADVSTLGIQRHNKYG